MPPGLVRGEQLALRVTEETGAPVRTAELAVRRWDSTFKTTRHRNPSLSTTSQPSAQQEPSPEGVAARALAEEMVAMGVPTVATGVTPAPAVAVEVMEVLRTASTQPVTPEQRPPDLSSALRSAQPEDLPDREAPAAPEPLPAQTALIALLGQLRSAFKESPLHPDSPAVIRR